MCVCVCVCGPEKGIAATETSPRKRGDFRDLPFRTPATPVGCLRVPVGKQDDEQNFYWLNAPTHTAAYPLKGIPPFHTLPKNC